MFWDEKLSSICTDPDCPMEPIIHRTELHIPIRRDPRSFEQRELDVFKELQSFIQRDDWDVKGEDWFREMRSDMERRQKTWEQEMARMREDFFELKPAGALTAGSLTTGGLTTGGLTTGGLTTGGQGSSSYSTSTSTSKTSTTKDGVTSTTSSSTTTSSTKDGSSSGTVALDSSAGQQDHKATYVRANDGQVHLQLRFDVKDFNPEDIRVVTRDRQLSVTARSEQRSGNSVNYREFSRSLDLPANVDAEALQCNLTQDSVLMIEAPVRTPQYAALTAATPVGAQRASNITPVLVRSGGLQVEGTTGTSVRTIDGQRRVHLEVAIGKDYEAGEINVKAESRKIFISARHEEKSANQSSFREFSKEFEIPETVDPSLITAKLQDGVLVVEAPL